MLSQSSISPAGTSTTLEQAIMLIDENQEESFVALFNTDPDGMFAVSSAENVYFYSRMPEKENMHNLICRLSFQYIADKTSLEQWDKAVAFYLGVGRYKANEQQYLDARINFKKAWFFMQKLAKQQGDTYDASNDVSVLQEWLSCTVLELESLPELDFTEMGYIYDKILILQQLTAIAIKLADRTQHPQDIQTIEKFHLESAELRCQLADYFDQSASNMKQTKTLLPLIDSRLRFAQVNIIEAIKLFKLTKGAEQKTLSAELKRELILGMRERLKAKLSSSKLLTSENRLYEIGTVVENINADVAQVRNLINDQVDINARMDFLAVVPDSEDNDLSETSLANWCVDAGSLEVLKLIIEELGAKAWLFSTVNKTGLIASLGNNSMPEVKEYLFTPNEKFYQIPEQKECVEFFQDALAGRLDNVKAKLKNNPELIYQFPVIQDDEDDNSQEYVLHMALRQTQLHVVWYLEDFIASYILTIKDYAVLEKLYHCMMTCYEKYDWNERRSIIVGILRDTLLDLLNATINELEKKPEKTKAEQKEYALCKLMILNVLASEGRKCEYDGEHCADADREMHYEMAGVKYQLVINEIFNPIFSESGDFYQNFCNMLWDSQARVNKILDGIAIRQVDEAKMDDGEEKKVTIPILLNVARPTPMTVQSWATSFQPAASTPTSPANNHVLDEEDGNVMHSSLKRSKHG